MHSRTFILILFAVVYSISLKARILTSSDSWALNKFNSSNDSTIALQLLEKGKTYGKQRQFDSAAYYAKASKEMFREMQMWDHYQMAGGDLVLSLIYLDQLDNASKINKEVRKAFEGQFTSDTSNYTRLLNIQGGIYSMLRKLDSGILIMEQLVALEKNIPGHEISMNMAGNYNNLGTLYTDYHIYDKALKYYDSAAMIHEKVLRKDSEYAARMYSNKAIVLKSAGNFEESLKHNRQSFLIFKNLLEEDHPRLALGLFNIAHDLIDRHDNDEDIHEALELLERGKQILDDGHNESHVYMIDYYRYSAKAYKILHQNELAIDHLNNAINRNITIYGKSHPDIGILKGELADVFIQMKSFDLAEKELDEAMDLFKDGIASDYKRIALIHSRKALIAQEKNLYQKALDLYNKAIAIYIPQVNFANPLNNPKVEDLIVDENLFMILQRKSEILQALHKHRQDPDYLHAALDTYMLISDYIKLSRKGFYGTFAKLKFNEKKDKIYQKGIHTAVELFEKTRDPRALDRAFSLADDHKSGILMETIGSSEARIFANISENLIDRENQLKASIDFTKKRIFEFKNQPAMQDSVLRKLEAKLFFLNTELEGLSKEIEAKYPSYHELKYNYDRIEIDKLKADLLGNNQALVQYFLSDSILYVFVLDRQGINHFQKPFNGENQQSILQFLSSIRDRDLALYSVKAHDLYKYLLAEIIDHYKTHNEQIDNLIIIPDGILGYIPFEVLISIDPEKNANYSQFNYLIKDFEISYHYSANLLSFNKENKEPTAHDPFIGFAPEFKGNRNQQLLAFNEAERSYMDKVSALPQAKQEVETIAKLLNGKANIGESATEYNFKEQSKNAHIIHLASHSLINDVDPLYSKLIFNAENDTVEDGLLHTYELYNMRLQAELACLSACNTGIGKYYRGEGIMSLARGFMYAGVPNVMMSLWSVSDQSTKDIMQYFYEELANGTPKSAALRAAKLKYLSTADNISADPYYWGAFIYLGEVNPETNRNPVIVLILFLVLLPLTFWIFIKFRGRKEHVDD
ncbi:CHAT domain-containing protein [Fulvivirgaceae bacterium BMA10]|uniref:CHAT domain-containing protein n=1 Tax=Splendidivirga corallicola TaxID=3051826 RepID=A0ABT8KKJ8_9BACT|nr:CHAT domain-containing protein [Fulvivirgaceae bacterium BMA10]